MQKAYIDFYKLLVDVRMLMTLSVRAQEEVRNMIELVLSITITYYHKQNVGRTMNVNMNDYF